MRKLKKSVCRGNINRKWILREEYKPLAGHIQKAEWMIKMSQKQLNKRKKEFWESTAVSTLVRANNNLNRQIYRFNSVANTQKQRINHVKYGLKIIQAEMKKKSYDLRR